MPTRRSILKSMFFAPVAVLSLHKVSDAEANSVEHERKPPQDFSSNVDEFYRKLEDIKQRHPGQKFTVLLADDAPRLLVGFIIYFIDESGKVVAYHQSVRLSAVKVALERRGRKVGKRLVISIEDFREDVKRRYPPPPQISKIVSI